MKELCLPAFDYKVKKQQGQMLIFDIVRKRYVVLTPRVGEAALHSFSGGLPGISRTIDRQWKKRWRFAD